MQNEIKVLEFPVQTLFENQNSKEWLTTNDAAKFLAVSPNALRIMDYRNQITVYKLGRRLAIPSEGLPSPFLKERGLKWLSEQLSEMERNL